MASIFCVFIHFLCFKSHYCQRRWIISSGISAILLSVHDQIQLPQQTQWDGAGVVS